MKPALLAAAALVALVATDAEAARSTRVVFESQGDRLVGDLYLPDSYKPGDKLPAVVVTGAWVTVKEQMAGRYASELADRGYAALAFDFRGWGQSEGVPRALENPERKTQDIVAAAAFLATRPEVDAGRIGGLGICASSGYMADAAARSLEIRSLALVAPWLHDRKIVETVYGGKDGVAKLLAAGDAAQASYEATSRESLILGSTAGEETALMPKVPYYSERDRGMIPEWDNAFNVASWRGWLTYDALRLAPALKGTPVAIVHSEAAAIPQGARAFYATLKQPKKQLWIENVSQLDFYDRTEPVRVSADFAAAHFAATLK